MKKTFTEAAQASKAIKQELKKAFPTVKFRVRSDNFSMGDSVNIDWTDGPTVKQVKAIVDKYQYGEFNGMNDSYEYTNKKEDLPQSKYVMTSRQISNEAYLQELEVLKTTRCGYENATLDSYIQNDYVYSTLRRRFNDRDLSKELVKNS